VCAIDIAINENVSPLPRYIVATARYRACDSSAHTFERALKYLRRSSQFVCYCMLMLSSDIWSHRLSLRYHKCGIFQCYENPRFSFETRRKETRFLKRMKYFGRLYNTTHSKLKNAMSVLCYSECICTNIICQNLISLFFSLMT